MAEELAEQQERLYYKTPPEKEFLEVKDKCIKMWCMMGFEGTYRREKIGEVSTIENMRDNMMFLIAMFSENNQRLLIDSLSQKCKVSVLKRMYDGGSDNIVLQYFPEVEIK